jgi:hypothetical protein
MTTDSRLYRIVAAQPYPLLFATISGAHLYGFPSPDSDYDLRGAHVLPLEKVVGLDVKHEAVASKVIDGLDMDIVSHDVRKFFGLLLKKNGYVLEQLFSPLIVHTTPEHAELKPICRPSPRRRSSRGHEAHSASGKSRSLLTSAATGVITKHHAHRSDGFEHLALAGFNDRDDMLAFDRRECVEEIFDGLAALQIINQVPERNARAYEDRCAPHDLRVGMNDAFEFFQLHAPECSSPSAGQEACSAFTVRL